MINAEKYKDKILTIAEDGYLFAINKNDKNNVIRCCSDMKCQDCMFDDEESEACGYNLPRLKWLFAEYKERVKLSRLELIINDRTLLWLHMIFQTPFPMCPLMLEN